MMMSCRSSAGLYCSAEEARQLVPGWWVQKQIPANCPSTSCHSKMASPVTWLQSLFLQLQSNQYRNIKKYNSQFISSLINNFYEKSINDLINKQISEWINQSKQKKTYGSELSSSSFTLVSECNLSSVTSCAFAFILNQITDNTKLINQCKVNFYVVCSKYY